MIDEKKIGAFLYSSDKKKLDVNYIHHYLGEESYWAKNIPREIVQKSIDGSLCFGVYYQDKQIGFARVITDYATFGYLADVFIDKHYRGKGLSKELMKFIMKQDVIKKLRRFMLATLDAHSLYTQFGFESQEGNKRLMGIKFFEEY
ncbi:MAG: GNAT family N-acetyltransferase [Bacteroidia bacterium]|jgi:GNAT superfamily N-acetyltransferase|nr:GNAT family N-acetyltransferase [Bacteroidia bacterium]